MSLVVVLRILFGLIVVAGVVASVVRRYDVRLTLIAAGLALGLATGHMADVVGKLFSTLANPEFIIPICSAMGFAYVLRLTGCDQHLVRLLVRPLRQARTLLIPGAVLVGFLVNMPIVSQTSVAVAIGPILIPLLCAARISPLTIGAALLLGTSLGGELLNPGAPEYQAVVAHAGEMGARITQDAIVRSALPLVLTQLVVATAVFWFISARFERVRAAEVSGYEENPPTDAATTHETQEAGDATQPSLEAENRVSIVKALIPLVPLALLFLTSEIKIRWLPHFTVPYSWLLTLDEIKRLATPAAMRPVFAPRLIGAAMLVGVAMAGLSDRKKAPELGKAFFDDAGYALANIVAVIVAAACFGEAIRWTGLTDGLRLAVESWPALLAPMSALFPLMFGVVSGSGVASTQLMFKVFAAPAVAHQVSLSHLAGLVSLSAAAGRTMSPVSAIALMCGNLTGTTSTDLTKRVALPLVAGLFAALMLSVLFRLYG